MRGIESRLKRERRTGCTKTKRNSTDVKDYTRDTRGHTKRHSRDRDNTNKRGKGEKTRVFERKKKVKTQREPIGNLETTKREKKKGQDEHQL